MLQVRGKLPDDLKRLLHGKHLVVHNGVSFDMPFLHTHGLSLEASSWFDTLVAETALVSTQRRDVSKSLRQSVRRRLDLTVDKNIEHSGWDADVLTERQVEYAATDVMHLPALKRAQLQRAEEGGMLDGLQMEIDLVLPVTYMTITGLPLDLPGFWNFLAEQEVARQKAWVNIQETLGKINMRSPKQLVDAMIRAGAEPPKVWRQLKTGMEERHTTAEAALLEMIEMGGRGAEVARMIMGYRTPDQRLKVYTREWAEQFVIDGVIHAKFWQCSTDTTRFSSSEPNLQQWARDMRPLIGHGQNSEDTQALQAGHRVVSVDYSQIEVRIAAHLARDQEMLSILDQEDIHRALASEIFSKAPEDISDEERRLAKAASFTLLFGGGVEKLHAQAKRDGAGITPDQAERLVHRFFDRFRGIARMREKAYNAARAGRPVVVRLPSGLKRTILGNKLRPTVILNTSVQGSAAVGLKWGVLEAHRRGLVKGRMGATVHDEVVCAFIPANEAEDYAKELNESMIAGMQKVGDFPVKTETKIGTHWS